MCIISFRRSQLDRDDLDDLRFYRIIRIVCLYIRDPVDDIHALDNLAESSILSVKMR